MTMPDALPEAREYMYANGQLYTHVCTLAEPHDGNHVCSCGYQWPLKFQAFAAWHQNHPSTP